MQKVKKQIVGKNTSVCCWKLVGSRQDLLSKESRGKALTDEADVKDLIQ